MNREILFRGKRDGDGEWVMGDRAGYSDYVMIWDLIDKGVGYLVDPTTVGQFTGLADKNGVKIFEGDILYCEARLDKAEMYVVFEQGQFRMVLCDKFKEYETGRGYYDINSFQKTVIGNIHDTPDLVKEEESE